MREGTEMAEAVSGRASGRRVQRDQDGLKGKQRVRKQQWCSHHGDVRHWPPGGPFDCSGVLVKRDSN